MNQHNDAHQHDGLDDLNEQSSKVNQPNPLKGFRGICAVTLVLEAVTILLALPIVAKIGGGITLLSGITIIGCALLMLVGTGLQKQPWALWYDLAMQVLLLLGFFTHWSIGAVGVVFSVVWAYLMYLRRDIAVRMKRSQQQ